MTFISYSAIITLETKKPTILKEETDMKKLIENAELWMKQNGIELDDVLAGTETTEDEWASSTEREKRGTIHLYQSENYFSMKSIKKNLMKELAIELGNRRKEGGCLNEPAFEIPEVAYKCGVTEQTVRNFEDGTSINPIVLLYYCRRIYEPCQNNRIDALIGDIVD